MRHGSSVQGKVAYNLFRSFSFSVAQSYAAVKAGNVLLVRAEGAKAAILAPLSFATIFAHAGQL
jgi:hypothetical protein